MVTTVLSRVRQTATEVFVEGHLDPVLADAQWDFTVPTAKRNVRLPVLVGHVTSTQRSAQMYVPLASLNMNVICRVAMAVITCHVTKTRVTASRDVDMAPTVPVVQTNVAQIVCTIHAIGVTVNVMVGVKMVFTVCRANIHA